MSYKLYDAEIEYLESTGTQWIDTGIFTVYNDGRTYKHIANLYYTVTNERQLNGANGSGYFGINKNGKFECAYIGDSGISARDSWHNINFSYYNPTDRSLNFKYKIDNQLKERTTPSTTLYDYAYAIYIFAIGGRDGAAPLFFCKERINSYQIYIDEVLVRDFIPVRVGNVGYLFDRVSGKLFGNSGTGDFVLGPDVAPAAYANEIAFLESTGSQYINSLYCPNNNTKIEAKGMYTHAGTYNSSDYMHFMYGVRETINGTIWQCEYLYNYYTSKQDNACNFGHSDTGEYYDYDFRNVAITTVNDITGGYIDGTKRFSQRDSTQQFQCTQPLYILWCNVDGTGYSGGPPYGRIYYLKVYENDTLIHDFIPVEYNNIGYLYDKVSGEFFANQGTGKFVLGHRAPRFDGKACARSYTRRQLMMEIGRPYDAEIEYLQSTASSGFNVVTDKEFSPQSTFELKYKIDNILGMYDQQSFFSRVTTPFRTPSVFMGSRANSYYYKAIDTAGKEKYLLRINSRNTNIHALTVNYENNTITLDGNQSAFDNSFTQYTVPSKIHIFGAIDSSHFGLYGKIYYFKISKNNQVLLDLIPVRKGNIGYMFDKVSRSILKNTESGTFILGPDKNI